MPEQHIDNEKIPTRLIGAIVAVGSLAFIGILTETVMTRGAVDGQVAYCLALFNCFYICKTILHEGFLVLRLGVERDVFRQMLFHARFIMVNVVVCEQYHIPQHTTNYFELLQWVDVVYLAVPNNQHARYAKVALEAGKHVIVEKPMAVNALQAE